MISDFFGCWLMKPSSPYSKLFTVNEANALLPVVRPMIENILEIIRRLRARSEVVIRAERIDPETPNLMGRLQQNDEIAELIKQINDSVHEIQQHGCVCKGVEQGLLDFPCLLGEEIVFLCWQYGEPQITYWHRIEDGFAGRRPLLDSSAAGSSGGGALH
jgi:hypothetical protein